MREVLFTRTGKQFAGQITWIQDEPGELFAEVRDENGAMVFPVEDVAGIRPMPR